MKTVQIGIDIGATKIAYALFCDGVNVYQTEEATDRKTTKQAFTETVSKTIEAILQKNDLPKEALIGIAMGFPSYVDYDRGVVVFSSNVPGLEDYHAKEAFSERFPGCLILVDNDTNLAALAEHRIGAGRGYKHMLYSAISSGLGSGFIINNDLFRGAYGGAGESGHMLINPEQGGLDCGCGNSGCFMSYSSGLMIMRHAARAIENGEYSLMSELVDGKLNALECTHLHKAFCANDALAIRLLDQIGYYLGIYVYNMFIGMNFNCYVFGGGLSHFGDALMDRIRANFDHFNHQKDQQVFIKWAELSEENPGLVGAKILLDENRS